MVLNGIGCRTHCCETAFGKLFTLQCLCNQTVKFGTGGKRKGNGRLWKRYGLPSITWDVISLPAQGHEL